MITTTHTELENLKGLYYKVHNLERFPNVIGDARNTLLNLFSATLLSTQGDTNDNILRIDHFDRSALLEFINTSHKSFGDR
jgi:hypothetical protein